jgi:hypothetical protein
MEQMAFQTRENRERKTSSGFTPYIKLSNNRGNTLPLIAQNTKLEKRQGH